ncbi:MAG TPA: trypsin-like peptidase domain-containing protein [Kofleriaceae bacterium]|nr:trypsin-like peptidase domain-containing protein [Kofleriaceae bacterium]
MAVLLLLVAGALVYMVVRGRNGGGSSPSGGATAVAAEPRAITPRGDLSSDEQSTIELFKRVSPSVVHVTSVEVRRGRLSLNMFEIPQGTGSGFIWDTDGHVVTNFHVIQNADRAEVTLNDNSVWRATIVGKAPDKDVAVLKIEAPREKLTKIMVGASNNLQVGQKVFAIGNPFGLDQTLTTGVISGLGREIQSITRRPISDVIQTDAAINPGNSGGPLLDSAGRLIGINTAIYSPSGAYAGIGFAVPVDTVNRIVPQLLAHGKVVRPGLGIVPASEQIVRQLKVQGVLVLSVPEGSAAEQAGLVGTTQGPQSWILGDLIVSVDGQPVKELNDLYRALDRHAVGDVVKLEVVRKGEKRTVDVKLQPLPEP